MPQPMATDRDVIEAQKSNIAKSAAETLLGALGGTHIYVRVPLAFVNAGDAAQLGQAGAASEDVRLAPVVVLAKDTTKKELLISAGALLRAVTDATMDAIADLSGQERSDQYASDVKAALAAGS